MFVQVLSPLICDQIVNLHIFNESEHLPLLLTQIGLNCTEKSVHFRIFIQEYNELLKQAIVLKLAVHLPCQLTLLVSNYIILWQLDRYYEELCKKLRTKIETLIIWQLQSIVLDDIPYYIAASIKYKRSWTANDNHNWIIIIREFCLLFQDIGFHYLLVNATYLKRTINNFILTQSLSVALQALKLMKMQCTVQECTCGGCKDAATGIFFHGRAKKRKN